jgi:alcohol dehydrogenase, propanol-preferring
VAGAGEVLVRVLACGVCHSDLHVALGEWELLKPITKVPLILGHEIAGVVESVGEGVDSLEVRDFVGIPWLHFTCGVCEYCLAGRETLCGKQQITGVTVNGGFAEFVKAPASHTVKLPDALQPEEAAPLLCAGLTVYRAIQDSGIQAGQRLAVFGIGGLGHVAIQVAKAMGVQVVAVDVSAEKLALATECGADAVVNATEGPVHKAIKALGGAHVALVTSASRSAYEAALRSLRKGGTLSMVGMGPEAIPISTVSMVSGEYRILATAVGTREDLRELLDLVTRASIRCRIETRLLEEVNQVFDELKAGAITGRAVLSFPRR